MLEVAAEVALKVYPGAPGVLDAVADMADGKNGLKVAEALLVLEPRAFEKSRS